MTTHYTSYEHDAMARAKPGKRKRPDVLDLFAVIAMLAFVAAYMLLTGWWTT